MLCDYHVHSHFSDDSDYFMEDVVKDAIKMKMQELCFTDHVDYGIKYDVNQLSKEEMERISKERGLLLLNVDYDHYFKELARLQQKYPQITIKRGLEFGIQTHTIPQYQKLIQKYDLDFVILSCHQVDNLEFWTQDFQKGKTQQEYNERYYQEILDVIEQFKDYQVLGHLDLIKRYDQAGIYPFEKIKDIVSKILKQVIRDGKGIEVNTSSHRYGLDDLMPSRDILKLYYQLGGTIITIGSDSHQPDHLGAYIKETREELKEIGFKYYCTFDHKKPIYHPL